MPVYLTDGRMGISLIGKEYEGAYMIHHGIKGQKWGIRRWQNDDGSLTPEGYIHYGYGKKPHEQVLFVSGSSKTQDQNSEYYSKKLPKEVRKQLKESMRNKEKIIVGDAPGIDRQVQDYLNQKKYRNVEIYGPGTQVRYSANPNWKTKAIDASEYEEGSKEWLAKKDEAMSKAATKGLAVVLEGGSSATRKNIERLTEEGKQVDIMTLSSIGKNKYERIAAQIDKMPQDEIDRKIQEYEKLKIEADKAGKDSAQKQIAYLDSLPDGNEKADEIVRILERSDAYSTQRGVNFNEDRKAGFSWNEAHALANAREQIDPQYTKLVWLENWVSGQISSKSGDWYNKTGVSKGFKKITDSINDLRNKEEALYNKLFENAKFEDYARLNKQHANDPQVISIHKQIDELTAQMPGQVLRDLGIKVTEKNIELIKPFVFWD